VDYLSTVSGGTYIGACLSSLLESMPEGEGGNPPEYPLKCTVPEDGAVRHLRLHCRLHSVGAILLAWLSGFLLIAITLFPLSQLVVKLLLFLGYLKHKMFQESPYSFPFQFPEAFSMTITILVVTFVLFLLHSLTAKARRWAKLRATILARADREEGYAEDMDPPGGGGGGGGGGGREHAAGGARGAAGRSRQELLAAPRDGGYARCYGMDEMAACCRMPWSRLWHCLLLPCAVLVCLVESVVLVQAWCEGGEGDWPSGADRNSTDIFPTTGGGSPAYNNTTGRFQGSWETRNGYLLMGFGIPIFPLAVLSLATVSWRGYWSKLQLGKLVPYLTLAVIFLFTQVAGDHLEVMPSPPPVIPPPSHPPPLGSLR